MTIDDNRLARIALACLVEPGDRELGLLVRRVGPVDALRLLMTSTVMAGTVMAGTVTQRLHEAAALRRTADPHQQVGAILGAAARFGARVVTPEDDEWPAQLDDLIRISDPNDKRPVERNTWPPHAPVGTRRGPPRRGLRAVGGRGGRPRGQRLRHVRGDRDGVRAGRPRLDGGLRRRVRYRRRGAPGGAEPPAA